MVRIANISFLCFPPSFLPHISHNAVFLGGSLLTSSSFFKQFGIVKHNIYRQDITQTRVEWARTMKRNLHQKVWGGKWCGIIKRLSIALTLKSIEAAAHDNDDWESERKENGINKETILSREENWILSNAIKFKKILKNEMRFREISRQFDSLSEKNPWKLNTFLCSSSHSYAE